MIQLLIILASIGAVMFRVIAYLVFVCLLCYIILPDEDDSEGSSTTGEAFINEQGNNGAGLQDWRGADELKK